MKEDFDFINELDFQQQLNDIDNNLDHLDRRRIDEILPTDPLFISPNEMPKHIEELRRTINFLNIFKFVKYQELKEKISNMREVDFFYDILIYLLLQFFLIYFYIFGGYLYIIHILIPFLNLEGKLKQDLNNIFSILLKNKYKQEEFTYLINKQKQKQNVLILFNIIKIALILFITILYPLIIYKCNDMIFTWSIQNLIKLSELLRNSPYIIFLLKLFTSKK